MAADGTGEGGSRPDSDEQARTGPASGSAGESMPRVDFSTFVLSLGTTALYQMGLVADPATGESGEADLLVAQQTVDTLEMLLEKTRGNLDENERKLIDSLLYELRMRFVEIRR
ncbi:MAG: DUF1844 domain-containing protein [bacterium]